MHRTQYVNSDGVSIAYQVLSESGSTLLNIPGLVSHLGFEDSMPVVARYFEHLSRFSRVIRFDKRGQGLSDRMSRPPTVEQQVRDIEAICAATGTERTILHGISHGAAIAVLYAIAHPDRVSHLILTAGLCGDFHDPFGPFSDDNALTDWDRALRALDRDYGRYAEGLARVSHPTSSEPERREFIAYLQSASSASALAGMIRSLIGFDIRSLLPRIQVPTLVFHSAHDQIAPVHHGRYFAEHIPDATLHVIDSHSHTPFADEHAMPLLVAAIEEFVTGQVRHTGDRVVVSVLFTDIVDSTAQQKTRGDSAWRTLRENFEARSTRCVEQFFGRIASFTGDGIMAEFPAPGDALRAAKALVADARDLDIQIRAGIHAGEAYRIGEDLSGTCVNIAARVSAAAGASEILTTEAVRGMVEGGGFAFDDAGEHDLKGIGSRQLVRLA